MSTYRVLIPYSHTGREDKALDFVVQVFAGRPDVELMLLNLSVPPPEVDLSGSPVMGRMKDTLGYLSQRLREQEAEMHSVRERLVQRGFAAAQVRILSESRQRDVLGSILA